MNKYKKLHTVYNNTGKRKLKSLFSLIAVGFSLFAHAQTTPTTSENYIYTKVYLSADGSKKNETVQYFDGLGRAKQVVQVKVTPLGQDLAIPVVYDDLGRQVKSILPVPVPTANLGIQNTVSETSANTYYGVSNAYTEQKLEASPMARTLETAHPGTEWAMNTGHTVKTQYLTNTTSDQVKRFATDAVWSNKMLTTSITGISTYGSSQLSKTIVTDENGNTTIEFKNSEGKTILVRKESGSTKQDTYYIYNDLNMLAFVISPKAVENIAANGNSVSQQVLNDLCYQYIYDNKYRLIEKKLPGKGWEYMVYDQQNRLVATQDANMKNNPDTPNQWLFTRYDKFGRIVYTGRFTGGTRAQEQANADLKGLNNEARSTTSFTQNTQEVFYSNSAYPAGTFTLYSVNYYDSYPGTNFNNTLPRPETILGQTVLTNSSTVTANGINSIRSTKAMPTATLVKNLDDDNWSSTHIWYDLTGRTIGSQGKNHLGGYTKTEKQLDFSGAVILANTYHKKLSTDTEISVKERFIYDNQFRLKQHYHQVNSLTEELLADYTYNELGQLTSKKVGNNLQDIQYTYNTRGWVSKINDPANLGSKLFGYEVKFGSTSNASVAQANYNGNITEVNWKTAADGILKRYSYQYDGYSRLTAAVYQEPETTVPQNGFYNENMSYDSNGNIMALNRNQKSYSGFAEQIDELMYTYNGNRLISVVDQKNNYSGYPDTSGNTITYDDNGNMTQHWDKGLLQIKYNHLNLPSYIKFNDYVTRNGQDIYSNVQYAYRADGVKIKKRFLYFSGKLKQDTFIDTEYIDGFQYSYEITDLLNTNGLKFFATSEGYYDNIKNKYIYHYVDHLGNVRVSFTREGAQAAIVEKNDYYAFGLKHGNPADTSGVNYNYEYNGKEFQQEIGMNDYGARFYMPDIGRWGVVDPLAEVYRRHSPYNYAVNNPMRFIDPDGMAARGTFDAGVEYTGQDAIDLFNAIKNLYGYNDNSNGDIPAPKVNSIDQSEAGTAGGGSSPTFQFPKGQEAYYQKNYPAFYDLVKYILPKMVQDKNFMNALSSVSGFSLEDLIEIFQYGKGGILSAEDIWPEAEYPYAHSQDKRLINSIIVDTDVLNWFEGANRNSKSFEGVVNIFYMVMVIGHETSHWGNWTKRTIRFENSGAPELFGSTEIGYFFEYSTLKSVYPNYPVRSGLNIGNFGNNISEQLKGFVKKNFSTLSNIFSN
ncbi:DUF6443 domain-containing protein [Chryseobacterium takakiae]|uniref:RHS repeat-associated core domain-containing protein n=1 Tax=Chryseobacterium takakiae TaxID=1302685 RepID=A0A1M5BQD5_9FLAO|nr:DUF6443 domain-containing protein [Chryseobacterium takakiae]SHF44472.1 RHS repeat-associated core domain-containing protein [Chryseobacterium takakiae]